eukprot:15327375-Ditylum_brightwellii.AAC.1
MELTSFYATYLMKEKEDCQRFMNDEEIASCHCVTLTARAKSLKSPSLGVGSANSLMSKSLGRIALKSPGRSSLVGKT